MRSVLAVLAIFSGVLFAAGPIKLVPVVSSGITNPTGVYFEPGTNDRMYIVEQKGKIQVFENGALRKTPALDIQDHVTFGGEMGLLGLAFHPDFKKNGRYFINYTNERPDLTTFIAELHMGSPDEKIILQFAQPFQNHNGGQLAFDQAGYLYIAAGDGGSAGDPNGNGQSLSTLLAKILRIDVNSQTGGRAYGIPSDNPFQGEDQRPEIFAYGLRNPWRFSFDRLTGALFAGDVGQDKYEEVDLVEKGKNYGWNTMEGTHCFNPSSGCDQEGLTLPLIDYTRSLGNCVTGGFVYRGTKIPALQGVYIYGDFGSGKIFGLTYDQAARKVIKNETLLNSHMAISSFGEDNDGELYVVGYQGKIMKIVAAQ